jgi:hypothetical protein
MVFVGGCATSLLITDPAAAPVRATQDVDAIAAIASLPEYHRPGDALRTQGFVQTLADGACFLATKLEAFEDRGRRDYLESHDFEDVLSVVDGSPATPITVVLDRLRSIVATAQA